MMQRAVFFAQSYDGHDIFWDVRDSADGEYDIYSCARGEDVRRAGHTLDAFVRVTQTEAVKTIFGPAYAPLSSLFEGQT